MAPPAAESYIDNQPKPYQQFIFAPSGSNYTICNVQNGACLTDGGNLLDIGQGTDTWAEGHSARVGVCRTRGRDNTWEQYHLP